MSIACMNPNGERHLIADGDRVLEIDFRVNWGANDLRDRWQGAYTFCSFRCLHEWAGARSADHDDRVVKDGDAGPSTQTVAAAEPDAASIADVVVAPREVIL